MSTVSSLLNLPYVPKLRILRFLDESALLRLRQSCRSMHRVVQESRHILRKRIIRDLFVTRQNSQSNKCIEYEIKIKNEEFKLMGPWILQQKGTKWMISHTSDSQLFFWIAETFANVSIGNLWLKQFNFDEHQADGLAEIWSRKKLTAPLINVIDCDYGGAETFVQILKILRPNFLFVSATDLTRTHNLLTDSFLKFIPSVQSFYIRPQINSDPSDAFDFDIWYLTQKNIFKSTPIATLPSHFDKFAPEFSVYWAFKMEIDHIKRLVHNWIQHDNEFHLIRVCLSSLYREPGALVAVLEIPQAEIINQREIVLTRPGIGSFRHRRFLLDVITTRRVTYSNLPSQSLPRNFTK